MTPYPEQIVRRALEHDRVRGTRIRPVKRLQLTGGLPFTTHFAERVVAWDNLKDEAVFFRGVDRLEHHGIPPTHLMAYMLVGFDPAETEERIFRRFDRMVERGIRPYPMVYDRARRDLVAFQRWVCTGLYRDHPWAEYRHNARRRDDPGPDLWEAAA